MPSHSWTLFWCLYPRASPPPGSDWVGKRRTEMVLGTRNPGGMLVSIELRGSVLRSARFHWTIPDFSRPQSVHPSSIECQVWNTIPRRPSLKCVDDVLWQSTRVWVSSLWSQSGIECHIGQGSLGVKFVLSKRNRVSYRSREFECQVCILKAE